MSLVRVTWTEEYTYTAEIEVQGFTLEHGAPHDLIMAVATMSDAELKEARDEDSLELDISGHEVIREGDKEED